MKRDQKERRGAEGDVVPLSLGRQILPPLLPLTTDQTTPVSPVPSPFQPRFWLWRSLASARSAMSSPTSCRSRFRERGLGEGSGGGGGQGGERQFPLATEEKREGG